MPKKQSSGGGGLLAKYGQKLANAYNKHKGDETELDTGLPPGIEDGVAQLTKCYFAEYKKGDNKGEYFFHASGTVVSPVEFDGKRIEGKTTSITEPLHDTPNRSRKTQEEHLEWVLNELRKLGLDTKELGVDSIEEACEMLQEQAPYFNFRTWKGDPTKQYPNPRTNHVWNGACEFDGEAADDVTDESGDADDDDDTDDDDNDADDAAPAAAVDEEDLDELARLADDEDNGTAQGRLTELSNAAGVSKEAYDEADNWAALAELIREAQGGEGAGDDDDDDDDDDGSAPADDWKPAKSEIYLYKPPRARKAVEVEITAVFEGKQTVNVKVLDDGRSIKGVPWDKLESD